jgi:hypothetical protein
MDWQELVRRLAAIPDALPAEEEDSPSPPSEPVPAAGDVPTFLAALAALGGEGVRVDRAGALPAVVDAYVPADAALLCPPLPASLTAALGGRPRVAPEDEEARFSVPWGVVLADAGLAETGSLAFFRRPGRPLTASLLPPALLAFLPARALLRSLPDLLRHPSWRARGGVLVTGPSRSADIENDLTIGVHGPGVLRVVILEGALGELEA